jgi:hypothetical protein
MASTESALIAEARSGLGGGVMKRRLLTLLYLSSVLTGCANPVQPTPTFDATIAPTIPVVPPPPPQFTTWVISGQSNAVGCAAGSGPSPVEDVLMRLNDAWVPASDPLPFLKVEPGHDFCHIGPWVTAAQLVKKDKPIHLTGWARGGSEIRWWAPGEYGWAKLEPLIPKGADVFLWWQGESDAVLYKDGTYQASLEDLVTRVRAAAQNPAMRVVVVGLADSPAPIWNVQYAKLRAAQQAFVAGDPNAVYVSSEGVPLQPGAGVFHVTADGYREVGRRIAAAIGGLK